MSEPGSPDQPQPDEFDKLVSGSSFGELSGDTAILETLTPWEIAPLEDVETTERIRSVVERRFHDIAQRQSGILTGVADLVRATVGEDPTHEQRTAVYIAPTHFAYDILLRYPHPRDLSEAMRTRDEQLRGEEGKRQREDLDKDSNQNKGWRFEHLTYLNPKTRSGVYYTILDTLYGDRFQAWREQTGAASSGTRGLLRRNK